MFRQPLTLVPASDDLKSYIKPISRWTKSQKPYTDYVTGFESIALPIPKKIAARLDAIKNGVIVVGKIAGKLRKHNWYCIWLRN